MSIQKSLVSLVALAALVCGMSTGANAGITTLTDANSRVEVDSTNQNGLFNWNVDGTHQMSQQWFWYRIGDTAERSIDTLNEFTFNPVDLNGDTNNDTLIIESRDAGLNFELRLVHILTGGTAGSNRSDLSEAIRIKNIGESPLDFHFFQYVDFDLNNSAGDDSIVITGAQFNTATQSDPLFEVGETVVTPPPSRYQVGTWPSLIDALNDAVATNLTNTAGPIGDTDATWAFQWDINIPVGGSFIISKDKNLRPAPQVPEPASCVLAGLGLIGLAVVARRRK